MRTGTFVVAFLAVVAGQSHAQQTENRTQTSRSVLERGSQWIADSVRGEANQPQPAASRPEVAVGSRVSALQTRLKQEEQLLQRQLAQFAKMRESALQKRDEKALTRISGLERQVVDNYQRRVERILAGNPLEKSGASPAVRQSAGDRAGKQVTDERSRNRHRRESPKRRGLFSWPFGR